MNANQLIQLKPAQIEAIAKHLEQVALELRQTLVEGHSMWVSDVQHIECIFTSSDCLLRELRGATGSFMKDGDAELNRTGRPRRTRRRKP
ncbi:MAG: hypothetical protein SFV81_17450 [Pirellulaceae bacterium]|nr:hypothetical protein [Pirellulaceae bacterium]